MGDKVTEGRVVRVLATAGWVVIVVAGMRAAGPLLVPLILSIFLALSFHVEHARHRLAEQLSSV